MKSKIKIFALTAIAVVTISGCSTWDKFNDKERGAVIGGGTGAVLGNVISPGVGGTLVGGAVGAVGGGLIGNERDKDKKKRR